MEAITIFINLLMNSKLKLNNLSFFKKINNKIQLNQDEIKEGYGYLFHAVQLNKFKVNDPTLVDKQGVINYLNESFGRGENRG